MIDLLEIIIANSGPSNNIYVPYKIHDPISLLLQRIQATFHTSGSRILRQDLFLNGRRLKDHSKTLAHYRIYGRTLTYRTVSAPTQRPKKLSIYIADATGKVILLTCCADTLVEEVKQLIEGKKGISAEEQSLTYAGMHLEDSRALSYYRVYDGSTFHLALPLPSNVTMPGILFVDNLGTLVGDRKIKFSRNASRGRVPTIGANVECECRCTPATRVICPKGIGTLEVAKTILICPNCGTPDNIIPVAIGFLKCKYRFHGIMLSDGGEQFTSDWKEVQGDDSYHLAEIDISGKYWRRLVIETAGLDQLDPCTVCLKPLVIYETKVCGHRFHMGCA
ncbi:hypothetical protein BGZ97_010426 [Linnemannia gamsii]|uniref:Ubiquitin-like domain-containing protein n=1 Tax=Linnemannia gamsii TaxID=64522 RepID=A0A9P6R7Z5_9FUNG|nr:hypothetical protein BGZ97_010426 [Linnemannia gamsii]